MSAPAPGFDKTPSRWVLPLIALGGVAVCAIPWLGGLVGLIGGIYMVAGARREKGWALLHQSRLPVSRISEVVPQQSVRLHGRVPAEPTFTEPISGRAVAHATITGTSSVIRNENERKHPPCCLGEAIVIDDGSGRAEVKLRDVHLLSRHVQSYCEHNESPLPALRAHFQIPSNEHLDVQEMAIDPGDELWVVGRVESVEEIPLEQPGGYREPGTRRNVTVVPDRAGLRVSNLTPEELAKVVASTPGYVVTGVLWLVAAASSIAYWGYRFFTS